MTHRLVAGPMVDQSELPFRMLCRAHGADLCFTPMLHAALFVKDAKYRRDNFTTCPDDRPLIVQFCANDPDTFAAAATLVEQDCDGVDLNLGCPQGIAKKGHYGAFLQDDWDLIARMVQAASKAVRIPVSCKIRVFPDPAKTVRYARALVAAGASMLTVHGRTREMKGIMTRLADWQQIKAVKQAVHVPVYGNGNIQWMANVEECVMETGVDGVVVAEALLHNPAFFSSRHIPCWRLCDQYLSIYHKYPTHVSHARAHLFKILHHILQLPENVSLRDAMTKSKTLTDLIGIVNSVRTLYEIKTEEQTLEMTTLPVPVYVAQPLYRIDRVVGPSHEVADAKRKSDAISEEEGGMGVGKKRKSGKEDRLKNLQLCAGCPNPRGLTCPFLFCRTCCLKDESRKGCGNHRKARKKNNFIGHDV